MNHNKAPEKQAEDYRRLTDEVLSRNRLMVSTDTGSVCHRLLLAVMMPVQPINSFGKRQPMSRNVFERLFEA